LTAVKRAAILTKGECLQVPLQELKPPRHGRTIKETGRSLNLRAVERAAILEALRKTNGRLGGLDGAAALLGLKRTTLQSRMRILNIATSHQQTNTP